jgi:hypothetical protein
MIKPLAIALSGVVMGLQEGDDEVNLNNVQCKAIQNCHNEFRYSKYMTQNGKKNMQLNFNE